MKELRQVYGLLGGGDRVDVFASTLPHEYDYLLRGAAYKWFSRWLGDGNAPPEEAPFDEGPEAALNCTATGQVMTSAGGRSVVQVNVDRMKAVAPQRPVSADRVREGLRRALALPAERTDLHAKTRSHSSVPGLIVEEFVFQPEPGLRIPGWFIKPGNASGRLPVSLFVGDAGKDELLLTAVQDGRLRGHAICLIDPRGMGASTPRFPAAGPQFYSDAVDYQYAWAALTLGKPVLGQRVWDYLRAVDYLQSRSDVNAAQMHAGGVGSSSLIALFAAVLDDRLQSVVLDRGLVDLASVVEAPDYALRTPWFVPGILRYLDLPDAVAALSPRPCRLVNPAGANGEALNESAVRGRYAQASNAKVMVGPELNWLAVV